MLRNNLKKLWQKMKKNIPDNITNHGKDKRIPHKIYQ
ncbi:hypothetical protein GGD38_000065 [Chitinophagaceae bacterium OAS944]|nr:hypothetical protein [Chitinophagaceae bacterium OAS944]